MAGSSARLTISAADNQLQVADESSTRPSTVRPQAAGASSRRAPRTISTADNLDVGANSGEADSKRSAPLTISTADDQPESPAKQPAEDGAPSSALLNVSTADDRQPPAGAHAQSTTAATANANKREVLARLWSALREVEDPEIPVSLVDMGLIVSIDYAEAEQAAQLQITYTAMGCPAMDMIQDDIRARLLREPDVQRVAIEVVWDPVWTHRRLSAAAREIMRNLGLAV